MTGREPWRQPHHGHPDPEWVALCHEAEQRDMVIGIHVTGGQPDGHPGWEWRRIEAVTVMRPGDPRAALTVYTSGAERLSSVANRTRRALKART